MQVVTIKNLIEILKIGEKGIYQLIKEEDFPRPLIFVNKNKTHKYRWLEKDINAWLETRR